MKKNVRNRVATLASGALCAGLLALGPTHADAQEPLRKLSLGDVSPIAAAWPEFVAFEEGFFKKHGLDVTLTYAGSAAGVGQQVVGGAFDIGICTFDTSMRAAVSGAPISLIGAIVIQLPYAVLTPATIRTAQDLKGKTVILPFQADISTAIWNHWLRDQGTNPKDVDQIYDGATPNRYAALVSKAAQAAFLGAPFNFRAEQEGYRVLVEYSEYAKNLGFTDVIARKDWLASHADTARRFVAAMSDAVDWLYDPANKDVAVKYLMTATKQDKDSSEKTYDYYVNKLRAFSRKLAVPNGYIDTEARLLADVGDIKSVAAVPQNYVDQSFRPE